MAATRALWSSAVTTILDTIFKSKGMGGRGVDGDAHPRLTLGRGSSEREIDEGDLPLRKNRGGGRLWWWRCEAKGEGGSKLGGAWWGGRVTVPFIAAERQFPGQEVRTRSSCAFNGGSAGASVAE
jgi:hypothetical protein